MPTNVTTVKVFAGGDATLLRRVDMDGVYITQATVASIQRTIHDISDPDAPIDVHDTAVVVADAVFDTLQTDGRWKRDPDGYNFRDVVPGSLLADDGHTYQVDYKFTGSGSQVFWAVFKVFCDPPIYAG